MEEIANEWEPGFYNPDEDYSKNERYHFVYMLYQTGVLYDMFDHAFSQWAERANVEYNNWCANADGDLFVTTIETMAGQGVDGILSDADMTIYPRVNEVMNDMGMPYMPVMGAPLDQDGRLMHAYCGFDFYMYGEQMANWVIDYWEQNFPEATLENSAMLCLDFSISENLTVRIDAARDVWNARYPGNEDKFYVADGAATGLLNSDTGYNISGPVIAAHPEVDYWIVCGLLDDYADGCARALELAGKDGQGGHHGHGRLRPHQPLGRRRGQLLEIRLLYRRDGLCRADLLRPVRSGARSRDERPAVAGLDQSQQGR
jgi:ABC-type sugar transport system substrate-binding protein